MVTRPPTRGRYITHERGRYVVHQIVGGAASRCYLTSSLFEAVFIARKN